MSLRSKPANDQKPGQNSRHGYRFQKASDIRQSLRNQNETTLVEALTALRNQLTLKADEYTAVDDERLLLVKSWLDVDPGVLDVFELWERTNTRQLAQLSLILSVLSSIIALLSTHYTYHALVTPVIRSILSPQWSAKLNSYLSTSHNELLLVTLKLYHNLSSFAGGSERRAILDAFPWELKSLPKLLHMRRRSKNEDAIDILARPDIRTFYVLFLLSFVDSSTSSSVKAAFLDQRRDNLLGIFKGLFQDSHTLVRHVLECCWAGIWCDPKIKRTAKIHLFNEHTVQQILRLYDRNVAEGEEAESVPADIAHHFLLAICARPGTGICFKDRGWYPREDEDQPTADTEEEGNRRHGVRVYNKILAGVLKGLKVNEDARQQELALRIIQACPELVAGYWHAAALTLEPRLSSKWIANIAFFGLVISLPVPQASFILSGLDLYRPDPPALSTILENILPSVNIKIHLSRGLQSTSALVQHCTALALAKCLVKYGEVIRSMTVAAEALEEDEEEGQWTRRRREVNREIARRVPDFQVVVAFGQQKTAELHTAMSAETKDQGLLSKATLLAESAQRLLWLYHEHLPSLVAETRFDVGKLLQGIQEGALEENGETSPPSGLVALRQLHVLRLLRESEDFSWSGKTGSRGNLSILLKLYTKADRSAMKSAVASLLRHTLSTTVAFQHDADEVDLWLTALPSIKRASDAQAPDGTPLTDEAEAVISLLDDCLQRCIKTPYRYLEELQVLCEVNSETRNAQDPSILPSPMLAVVLDQLQAKVTGNLLSPSDTLAIVTFVRKLMLQMAGKLSSLDLLDAVANRVNALSFDQGYLGTSIHAAIARECKMLANCRSHLTVISLPRVSKYNPLVGEFTEQYHRGSFKSKHALEKAISALIDSLRFADSWTSGQQVTGLFDHLQGLPQGMVDNLLSFLPPESGIAWHSAHEASQFPGLRFDFATMMLHYRNIGGGSAASRDLILQHLPTSTTVHIKRALRLIDHRLVSTESSHPAYNDLIGLLVIVMNKVKNNALQLFDDVKQFLFGLEGVQRCCKDVLPEATRATLGELLADVIDVKKSGDQDLVAPFTEFWGQLLSGKLSILEDDELYTAILWLGVMDARRILALIDQLASDDLLDPKVKAVLEASMMVLARTGKHGDISGIVSRLSTLLSLHDTLADSKAWEQVVDIAVDGYLPLCYDGKSLPEVANYKTFADLIEESCARRGAPSHNSSVDLMLFLDRASWTDLTASIIARLTYSQSSQRANIRDWFRGGKWQERSAIHIIAVLRALLDTCLPSSPFSEDDDKVLVALCERILAEISSPFEKDLTRSIIFCVKAIADSHPNVRSKVALFLQGRVKSKNFNGSLCTLALHLDPQGSLGSSVIDAGMKWAVATLSEKSMSSNERDSLSELRHALQRLQPKAHYAESVISVAIQNHLTDKDVLAFVRTLLSHVQFKPLTVNRYLQSITQHSKFPALSSSATREHGEARAEVVAILHKLFHSHPSNTCQPSHIEPLQVVYSGTLSVSDRQLLSIFRLFEVTRRASVSSLLSCWSPTSDISCNTALEVVQSLDPTRIMKTCVSFPQYYDDDLETIDAVCVEQNYDPVFVMLLFSRMLAESLPATALAWVQMFRTNVVSLLVRALSSHKGDVRVLATSQLAGLYASLQGADMQEKAHVLYILNLLKNTFAEGNSEEHTPRLPAYSTLHLAHALRAIFYPATFTYPLTARFLLQRHEFDISDVPLLYNTLYSVDDQWKKERAWIVRFLADGMVGRQEWRVLKRRHTWDLIASIFQSEQHDLTLRRVALEFLANLSCNKAAIMSLVLGSGLLSWIELQLHTIRASEALGWAKIIENVITVVDISRLETATAGEWRSIIIRCLLRLLHSSVCDQDVLVHTVCVVLRISAARISHQELEHLITPATARLTILEKGMEPQQDEVQLLELPKGPYTSSTLWQGYSATTWSLWGFCVEGLWRASMLVDEKVSAWDVLLSRLLVWRALAGDTTQIGEWARREVVQNISSS